MSTSHMLLILVTYLVCVSTALSMTFEDDVESISLQPHVNFTVSDGDLSNLQNITDIPHLVTEGQWETQTGRGLYSVLNTSKGLIFTRPAENTILFTEIETVSEGIYNITYEFYNPNHNEFEVYLVYRGGFLNPLGISAEEDGFHLFGSLIEPFYASNVTDQDYVNITTNFDPETGELKVIYEDTVIFTEQIVIFAPYLMPVNHYFAGVTSYGSDFEILSFSGSVIYEAETDSFSFQTFTRTILLLFFWTLPETILPLTFNIIFIKVPLVGLVFIMIQTTRGTG